MTFANCFFFLCKVLKIHPEMYAETKMAKTRRQIRRADFAMTNLIKFTESVNPSTFTWFEEILSILTLELLRAFLDISGVFLLFLHFHRPMRSTKEWTI